MRILIVKEKDNGKKLNTVLLSEFEKLSMNTLYKALRKKDIRINNNKISENVSVNAGDEIKLFITDELLLGNSDKSVKIEQESIDRKSVV